MGRLRLGRVALPASAFVLVLGIVAVGLSQKRYDAAYQWVAHTSDVRLVIGRAIGRLGTLDTRACTALRSDIEEIALLTRDNAVQQRRVETLRRARIEACDGHPQSLLPALADADAHERQLMLTRRERLAETRMWTLAALTITVVGALTILAIAWTLQRRSLAAVQALNKKLEDIAITDELTKLHNRRGFLLLGEQAFLLAKRQKKRVAVLFADLDGLKMINDRQGHEKGDQAIRAFGETLRNTVRTTDVVARLGGDEFVALLYDVSDVQIAQIEARLREALAERSKTEGMTLAASIGIAQTTDEETRSLEKVIEEADKLMYEKKKSSRAKRTSDLRIAR